MPLPKTETYTTEYIYSLPEGKRAELIDGVVYDMAPPSRMHQRIIFSIAVGNPSVNKHFLKRVQIGDCLIGRGHIRLGNDFHKRSSAAIEVDSGGLRIVVDLRGILLEMDMVDADELLRPVSERNLNAAADA